MFFLCHSNLFLNAFCEINFLWKQAFINGIYCICSFYSTTHEMGGKTSRERHKSAPRSKLKKNNSISRSQGIISKISQYRKNPKEPFGSKKAIFSHQNRNQNFFCSFIIKNIKARFLLCNRNFP